MDRDEVLHPQDAVRYYIEHSDVPFTEGYIVEATVELVVRGDAYYRLEAYREIHDPGTRYDVHAYLRKGDIWEFVDIGYCDRATATEALMQAIGFIEDYFRNH